jgi:hypothetical protein
MGKFEVGKIKIVKRKLTSSKGRVAELPAAKSKFLLKSTLGFFSEGARGLAAGVDVFISSWREGEVSSAARHASE